jgi:hypothetical protein
MVKAIARAFRWLEQLENGNAEIAAEVLLTARSLHEQHDPRRRNPP